MKLLPILTSLLLALPASASDIFVNFNGSQNGHGPVTGIAFGIPANKWINVGSAPSNSKGFTLGEAILVWDSGGTWGDNKIPTPGNQSLFGGYLDDSQNKPATFTVTGLTKEIGTLYTVTIYGFSEELNGGVTDTMLNGSSRTPSKLLHFSGEPKGLTGTAGIAVFQNVSSDKIVITKMPRVNNKRATISGFSIVAQSPSLSKMKPLPSLLEFNGISVHLELGK